MNKIRIIMLVLSVSLCAFLIYIVSSERHDLPMESSLSPAYILLGKTFGQTNHALTKLMPLNSEDEEAYGNAIRIRYEQYYKEDKNTLYVNSILKKLAVHKKKNFDYTAFILSESYINAFALPGGVIFVTEGLLGSVRNEAELAAVLSHEIGHIELSHCLDAVRMELLAQKAGVETLGQVADFAVNVMLRHSFSKSQEDAADEYALKLLQETEYDLYGLSGTFEMFVREEGETSDHAEIIKEYFMSHPYSEHRLAKAKADAEQWYSENPGRRYRGVKNLSEKVSFYDMPYDDEWTENENPNQ
ncbi:MAG: M48 family metallopeptidase [Spirochaetia bacterium]|nr:M48 family metallopeptidase [Spirochaetia bacterium]